MANISEITIEVPLTGFIGKKMKNSLKKVAAATGTKIIQTTGQYMGEKPTEKEQTQKFITNEPPTTPAMSETPTTENNKKGFPWWIVAAAGVGLILLNSNNKKRKK